VDQYCAGAGASFQSQHLFTYQPSIIHHSYVPWNQNYIQAAHLRPYMTPDLSSAPHCVPMRRFVNMWFNDMTLFFLLSLIRIVQILSSFKLFQTCMMSYIYIVFCVFQKNKSHTFSFLHELSLIIYAIHTFNDLNTLVIMSIYLTSQNSF